MATQGRSRGRRRAEVVEAVPAKRARNAKHADKELEAMKPLVPMTEKQKRYINLIECKDLVFATGYAGTSKTYIPTAIACRKWKAGDIDKIILTRPNVSNSKSLGAFKGTLVEKMTPWLGPVLGVMYEYLGKTVTDLAIENGNIEFIPMEVIKGYSLSNAFIICDEAEDLSFDDAKKLVTRQGENSTLVLAGDITQSELKAGSGLRKLIDIANRNKNINAGLVDFNHLDDIVRHPIVKEWIRAFEKEGV
jgi:phosphate starvation-inducible PhoH-like protein